MVQENLIPKVMQERVDAMADFRDIKLHHIRLRQIIITSVPHCIVDRYLKEKIKMIPEDLTHL